MLKRNSVAYAFDSDAEVLPLPHRGRTAYTFEKFFVTVHSLRDEKPLAEPRDAGEVMILAITVTNDHRRRFATPSDALGLQTFLDHDRRGHRAVAIRIGENEPLEPSAPYGILTDMYYVQHRRAIRRPTPNSGAAGSSVECDDFLHSSNTLPFGVVSGGGNQIGCDLPSRQPQRKLGALPRFALDPDRAAVGFDDLAGRRQAEAGATGAGGVEGVEDAGRGRPGACRRPCRSPPARSTGLRHASAGAARPPRASPGGR